MSKIVSPGRINPADGPDGATPMTIRFERKRKTRARELRPSKVQSHSTAVIPRSPTISLRGDACGVSCAFAPLTATTIAYTVSVAIFRVIISIAPPARFSLIRCSPGLA